MALANSLTLKIAGVTSLTEDPVGGTIMRLPSGGNDLNCTEAFCVVVCILKSNGICFL